MPMALWLDWRPVIMRLGSKAFVHVRCESTSGLENKYITTKCSAPKDSPDDAFQAQVEKWELQTPFIHLLEFSRKLDSA